MKHSYLTDKFFINNRPRKIYLAYQKIVMGSCQN